MSQDVMIKKNLKRFSAADVGFFEGPEKLLEVWFDLGSNFVENARGLRKVPRHQWEKILEIAQCKILSTCSNEYVDAYLLSESSLLISDQRFILKTCGNTKLLSAIPPLVSLVEKYYPGARVMNLYYSHRRFLQPLLQPLPHSDFDLEVSYLNEIFEGGTSKSFGKGDDVWYLYGLERKKLDAPDQTLEILMNDLDPDFMALFSTAAFDSSADLILSTGLSTLMPDAIIDAKIFEPCGFSLNAIDKDVYYTIHITPQVECSWVSFETNSDIRCCSSLIGKVLEIFHPGKAAVSIMTNEDINVEAFTGQNKHYSRVNFECSRMATYTVLYVELRSQTDSVCDKESCLSKAISWSQNISKQALEWMNF